MPGQQLPHPSLPASTGDGVRSTASAERCGPGRRPGRAASTPPPFLHRTAFATKWKKRQNPLATNVPAGSWAPGSVPRTRTPTLGSGPLTEAAESENGAERLLLLILAPATPDPRPFRVRCRMKLAGQICVRRQNTSVTARTGPCESYRRLRGEPSAAPALAGGGFRAGSAGGPGARQGQHSRGAQRPASAKPSRPGQGEEPGEAGKEGSGHPEVGGEASEEEARVNTIGVHRTPDTEA